MFSETVFFIVAGLPVISGISDDLPHVVFLNRLRKTGLALAQFCMCCAMLSTRVSHRRVLAALPDFCGAAEALQSPRRTDDDVEAISVEPIMLDGETTFRRALDNELERISAFYEKKVASATLGCDGGAGRQLF